MAVQWPGTDGDVALVPQIVDAVAALRETDPLSHSGPLYEVIDPDALRRLVHQSERSDLEIQFEYHGCLVTVEGDGTVIVAPTEESLLESEYSRD